MSYATEHIANTLKTAREANGLSQRALSEKSGVPQSHISKIENGAVDLRVSSLVALARVLDLELMLVPRKSVSAVQSFVRASASSEKAAARHAPKELTQMRNAINQLSPNQLTESQLVEIQRWVRELENFRLSPVDHEAIQASLRTFKVYLDDPMNQWALTEASKQLRELRNHLAHQSMRRTANESARPAYSLEEDEHG